jgi:cation transport regulator ChaC
LSGRGGDAVAVNHVARAIGDNRRMRVAVFAYGSLVDPASAMLTLGRPVESTIKARLPGWRRSFSQARDNRACEKTFARADDGTIPPFVLGLNIERGRGPAPNGVLIPLTPDDLERLDRRELRYRRTEVSAAVAVAAAGRLPFECVYAYLARPAHLASPPPAGAIILRSYAQRVEQAFATLGPEQLAEYRRTTLPYPVEVAEGRLVRDRIPLGNPREW